MKAKVSDNYYTPCITKTYNETSCGAKAQQTPSPCCASHHRAFLRIDQKLNDIVPWSLHTFPENFMQIGPAIFS